MHRYRNVLMLALGLAGCSQAHYDNRLPGAYQAQYVAGRAALQEGDPERSAELLAAAAESEHPYAEIEYARVLVSGQNSEEDRPEAIRLLEFAYAKSSDRKADAAYYLGRLLVDDQPERALELLSYARAAGQTRRRVRDRHPARRAGRHGRGRDILARGRSRRAPRGPGEAGRAVSRARPARAGASLRCASAGAVPRPGRSGRRRRHADAGKRL